jgi:predicted phosphodiesterase
MRGGCDLVILAGDIHTKSRGVAWAQSTFDVPVIYVSGNHELYKGHFDNTLRSMKELALGTNVHVLEEDSVVIDGARVLGATGWTDFSAGGNVFQSSEEARRGMNDFRRIRAGEGYRALSVSDVINRNRQTHEWLSHKLSEEFNGKTIVVTHHCPLTELSGPEKNSALMPAYSNQWPELVKQADLWVFGHTHSHVDEMVGACRVVSNPHGYPGEECGFDSGFIIEI